MSLLSVKRPPKESQRLVRTAASTGDTLAA